MRYPLSLLVLVLALSVAESLASETMAQLTGQRDTDTESDKKQSSTTTEQSTTTDKAVSAKYTGIEVTSELAGTVTIQRTADGGWLVTQLKARDEGPAGKRPPDYAQAPTWLKIQNPGPAQFVSIAVKWIDTTYMGFRKSGYLKVAETWTVVSGEPSLDATTYKIEVPQGLSWFGPVPWYDNDDATRFIDWIQSSNPGVRIRQLGKSKEGRDIRCITIANEKSTPPQPNVLVVGREHGGESASSFAIEAVVEHILSESFPQSLRDAYSFHVVPLANPDGVANGRTLPQQGPVELSDLHYAGMTANDPTCVVMRDEILRLKPVSFINYHSYLFPMPEIIFYKKQDGVRMLDMLIGMTEKGTEGDGWYVRRLAPGGDSALFHCHKAFDSSVVLFELPWAGRKVEVIRTQAVASFRAALLALTSKVEDRQ